MYRYVIKRLLFLIPTILGVILIIFLVMNLTPSTPGRIMLGPSATEADVEQLNHELGYDKPILERYAEHPTILSSLCLMKYGPAISRP